MSNLTTKKVVRLCVIASDYGAAANIGGGIETHVRTFDLPQEVVDHILSIENGGCAWDSSNLQSLCASHHDAKSARELMQRRIAPKGGGVGQKYGQMRV